MIKGFSIIFILICFLTLITTVVWSFVLIGQNHYENSPIAIINLGLDKKNDLSNLIQVTTPQPHQIIKSPLLIRGQARGTWYFEASFPVKLLDSQDKELARGIAQAQSDWMTEDFVPFTVTLVFTKPVTVAGTLVLQKDNPSGLPEHDAQIGVPILFSENNQTVGQPCVITGCSKQICAEKEGVTSCEFKPEYVCYTKAKCERQADEQCGWTKTSDLETCLAEFN